MSSLYFWGKPITTRLFQSEAAGPSFAPFDKAISQISCGEKHCVMIAEGNVFGFGDNSQGQLGEKVEQSEQAIVSLVIPSANVIKQVACGWNHTLLLDVEGTVYSAGRGEQGELGRGKSSENSFEVVIRGARQVSAGKDHSLALCGSKVMGWGNSREGQLGLLSRKVCYYPQELNVYPASFVFAGAKYSLFVTSKGVFGTGLNHNCQLGLGHHTDVQMPRKLAIDEEILSVSGGNYCAARTVQNQWYLWGSGGFGVFKYPTKMSFLSGGECVAMGLNFGLLSRRGQVWVWGSNRWGELGCGEECRDYAVEAEEMGDLDLTAIVTGGNFVVGFKNQKEENSFSNPLKGSLSECNEQENSSISKELFKHFKRSSGRPSQNNQNNCGDSPLGRQANGWAKFYEIRHDYDFVHDPHPQLPPSLQKQPQNSRNQSRPQLRKTGMDAGYMTWECGQPRRVKLTESLKALTGQQWTHLKKENKNLKERLQHERAQREKTRAEYVNIQNMSADNRVLQKILKLEDKIYKKNTGMPPKGKAEEAQRAQNFSKKLHSLKSLLQSAL